MAKLKLKLDDNVEGNYFVDSTCIDCSACRRFAPSTFGDGEDFAFVKQQPVLEAEIRSANQALLSCPTASIGTVEKVNLHSAKGSFPIELIPGIYINGFNKKDSYGADSYFIESDSGNWLVDSPRFIKNLVRKFEELGGIKYVFLTHQDDVADAHLYANHFQAKRIIHRMDSSAQKDSEIILQGEENFLIEKAKIIFTPGHTEGHLVMLWDNKYLFTGDHFAWLRRLNDGVLSAISAGIHGRSRLNPLKNSTGLRRCNGYSRDMEIVAKLKKVNFLMSLMIPLLG